MMAELPLGLSMEKSRRAVNLLVEHISMMMAELPLGLSMDMGHMGMKTALHCAPYIYLLISAS